MERNRILAACILAAFVLFLLAVIWRQQGEIERRDKQIEGFVRDRGELERRLEGAAVRCAE